MLSSTFLGITTFVYLLCMALYFCYLFFRNEKFSKVISAAAILGLLLNTTGLGLRWYESYKIGFGHIPLSNMYESLTALAWTTVLLYLIIEFRYKVKALGALVFPIVSVSMAIAANKTHGSRMFNPRPKFRWSHTKNPSHPASSHVFANSA